MSTTVIDQDYIRVVDHAVSPALCATIRERFEQQSRFHHYDGDRYIELDLFKQRNRWLPQDAAWRNTADQLVEIVNHQTAHYRLKWDPLGMMPPDYAMEGMRVKAYRVNTHEFRMHVDQANRDSATRFLAVLLYLNDNSAGTEFHTPQLTVAAQEGRMLIFPPTWQYPHRGLMPTQSDKYILSTYLHYKD